MSHSATGLSGIGSRFVESILKLKVFWSLLSSVKHTHSHSLTLESPIDLYLCFWIWTGDLSCCAAMSPSTKNGVTFLWKHHKSYKPWPTQWNFMFLRFFYFFTMNFQNPKKKKKNKWSKIQYKLLKINTQIFFFFSFLTHGKKHWAKTSPCGRWLCSVLFAFFSSFLFFFLRSKNMVFTNVKPPSPAIAPRITHTVH